jgi:hypothetical protein
MPARHPYRLSLASALLIVAGPALAQSDAAAVSSARAAALPELTAPPDQIIPPPYDRYGVGIDARLQLNRSPERPGRAAGWPPPSRFEPRSPGRAGARGRRR